MRVIEWRNALSADVTVGKTCGKMVCHSYDRRQVAVALGRCGEVPEVLVKTSSVKCPVVRMCIVRVLR